jgi:GNAT superfamily N-acetyltransferase
MQYGYGESSQWKPMPSGSPPIEGQSVACALRVRELTAAVEDRELLSDFYESLYVPEFPDPDGRESLENIQRYLDLKGRGWYGPNNYHVVVLLDKAARCVAGSIFEYLAGPNAGVIEFLVVHPEQRGRGLGTYIHEVTEAMIAADARERTGRGPVCIVAEINDPCQSSMVEDSIDPFVRALIWSGWGYQRLDFPYVQPALSAHQQPVRHLVLAIKAVQAEYRRRVPAPLVAHILREYMRWAMRIENPDQVPEYLEMQAALNRFGTVAVVPLARVLNSR